MSDKFNQITAAIDLHDRTYGLLPFLKGWKYHPGNTDEDRDGKQVLRGHAYLNHEDGRELSLWYDNAWNPRRLVIYGSLPTKRDGRVCYFASYQPESKLTRKITVAIEKPPEKIAQDIIRRLLPDHQKAVNAAKEGMSKEDTFTDAKTAAIEAIAVLLNETVTDDWRRADSSPTLGRYSGVQCRVHSGTSFDITVSVSSLNKAEEIIKAVQSIGGIND